MSKVKFAVMTDFHYEHIPDGQWRLREFLTRADNEKVDFIIQLGDFCRPTGQNRRLLQMLCHAGKPVYHSIGNHDTDDSPKEEMVKWLNMKNSYYAFTCGAVRFIVLDANFIGYEREVVPYSRAQNKTKPGVYPYIPKEELHWLEAELMERSLPVIIFSHHSLENNHSKRGISNRNAVQELISRYEERGGEILCCINGHDHADSLEIFHGVYYLTLNSMSYKYLEFESLGLTDRVKSRHPELEEIIPYDTPLSAVITVHDNHDVEVSGMEGRFPYGFSPQEFGITHWDNRPVNANIQSRILRYRQNNGKTGRENMTKVNPALKEYIRSQIIPLYQGFDDAHQIGHVQAVIENSFLIANDLNEELDTNMIYVIAAYHDVGLSGGRENHERRSGTYLLRDKNLKNWFTDGQIQTMADAAEDHRASNKHEPRSIYGKIVAEADRDITYGKILARCIQYSLNHFPDYDEKQHYERTRRHMKEKYGEDGYLVLWLDTKQNRENLTELRRRLRTETVFRQDFCVAYREVCAEKTGRS